MLCAKMATAECIANRTCALRLSDWLRPLKDGLSRKSRFGERSIFKSNSCRGQTRFVIQTSELLNTSSMRGLEGFRCPRDGSSETLLQKEKLPPHHRKSLDPGKRRGRSPPTPRAGNFSGQRKVPLSFEKAHQNPQDTPSSHLCTAPKAAARSV